MSVTLPLPPLHNARVLVAGDLMLDRYWSGTSERISPEAPVPVVNVQQSREQLGGAANVAAGLAALQVQVTLAGAVGDDPEGQTLLRLLDAAQVESCVNVVAGLPTITKLRVMSQQQQLLRLDFEQRLPALNPLEWPLQDTSRHWDCVVLSDYDKGTLGDPQVLIDQARGRQIPILVDPKGQDFKRYRGATLLTPNESELRAALGCWESERDLQHAVAALLQELELGALLLTRGSAGMTLFQSQQPPLQYPAQAREVFDVTGAGDTVIAVVAAALGAGVALTEAISLANIAAGEVVTRLGTATLSPLEIAEAARSTAYIATGIVQIAELRLAVAAAQLNHQRVVFTNGCFDILHAGHVACLTQARSRGDRLVVAVNTDASVSRLKGPARPVTPLAQRMQVLAALEAVDWVISFDQDSPEQLLAALQPDLLVKGGDYQLDQVVGRDLVESYGGRVEVLDLQPGLSTSGLLDRSQT